ncbi:hypothetical protein OIO90_005893 [Microbotryomycetes sp. JL221]|nr:hypothetical protein OIO90_005893 [Microbotryomycetes sp. JL221]
MTRRQGVMDDDVTRAGPSSPKKRNTNSIQTKRSRLTTPPPSSPSRTTKSSPPSSSSPSLALTFAGKVYRTLNMREGGSNETYLSPEVNLLGEPDELAGEAQAEKKRDEIKKAMLVMQQTSPCQSPRNKPIKTDGISITGTKRTRTQMLDLRESNSNKDQDYQQDSNFSTPTKLPCDKNVKQLHGSSQGSHGFGLGLPFSPASTSSSSSPVKSHKRTRTISSNTNSWSSLPQPLADLVTLQSSIESAIIVHLGTAGTGVASSMTEFNKDNKATMRIPNLIHLSELSKMVRCGKKQLGEQELSNLLWAWKGCGLSKSDHLKQLTSSERISDDEDDLKVTQTGLDETGGLGFIVSTARIGKGTSIQMTYSLGIEVEVKVNPQLPTLELVGHGSTASSFPSSPKSPGNAVRGRDGMNVVALWTAGKDARSEELTRRLKRWAQQYARHDQSHAGSVDDLDTVISLPAIPKARLPSLAPARPSIIGTPSPSPKKRVRTLDKIETDVPVAGSSKQAVTMLLEGKPSSTIKTTVKASERNRLMRERLAVKFAEAQKPLANHAFLSNLSGDTFTSTKKSLRHERSIKDQIDQQQDWKSIKRETFKRNAMISRLGNIADVVIMLSLKSVGKPMLMEDVASSVAHSPLVHVGQDEAYESLELLCHLFPDFAYMKRLDRQDWLFVKRDAKAIDVKVRVASELEGVRDQAQ